MRVVPGVDEDAAELDALARQLRAELLELDVDGVERLTAEDLPALAKGVGTTMGALVVRLGITQGLRAVVNAVKRWAARSEKSVEITFGEDSLKVTGISSEQQERLIEIWLERQNIS
ncbi:hypothetical protein QCN29_05170 [Streptomyces sp. HNM0663]|uniref:Uncharacterized protein n=1 Tax=Streptomyces chengmaiensis TaxID=3040919 RepID=A0ABT6HJY4_9ACTN|nr:hypothetical protein [Streptomyces chengmaiensis]MDH2388189.1 hypothetical protein [Streptomyces chengmaiensis]